MTAKQADDHTPIKSAMIQSISAVSLVTHDMVRAVRFYQALGFVLRYGGECSSFTSLAAGSGYLNLIAQTMDREWLWWGRVVFYVSDVDAFYHHAHGQGLQPDTLPQDAEWGERFFHITDPDGHELSFAKPIARMTADRNRLGPLLCIKVRGTRTNSGIPQ